MVLQTAIVSLLLILTIHHLFLYFQTTLTIHKEKDMNPVKKYESIMKKIEDRVVEPPPIDMKLELKEYMKTHLL